MEDIQKLRKKIDEIDEHMLRLLGERSRNLQVDRLTEERQWLTNNRHHRENEVYSNIKSKAPDFGLEPEQVEAVFRQIVIMCSNIQELKEKNRMRQQQSLCFMR